MTAPATPSPAGGYKLLLDVPASDPALNFDDYAAALSDIVSNSDARFAVGIFGDWGSGKTTLMEAIRARLDPNVVSVWFNAWRYEKEQHLIVPLLDVVRESLVEWSRTQKKPSIASTTASKVGKVIQSLLAGFTIKAGIPDTLEVSFEANKTLAEATALAKEDRNAEIPRSYYHAAFRGLEAAFREFLSEDSQRRRRIVVFVDDLDRCLPERALEVLESMKLFFDLDGFVFVVGLDDRVVQVAVEARYAATTASQNGDRDARQIRGREYLKKIFQVPFGLLPVGPGNMNAYLHSAMTEAKLPLAQIQDLNVTVRPHLGYLVQDGSINPREVKRYINSYTLTVRMRPLLDRNAVLAMQTIAFRRDWAMVQQKLSAYRGLFLDALSQSVSGNTHALEALDPDLSEIPPRFLDYVGSNGPAKALLQVPNIDEYLSAGEATRSQFAVGVSDLVRDVTGLRKVLRETMRANGAANVQPVRNTISELRGRFTSMTNVPTAVAQLSRRRLEDLDGLLGRPPEKVEGRDAWFREADELVRRVVGELLEWSRL